LQKNKTKKSLELLRSAVEKKAATEAQNVIFFFRPELAGTPATHEGRYPRELLLPVAGSKF